MAGERGNDPLRGVTPIVVTPFASDGSVDLDQFDQQIDFLLSTGVTWVGFGFGSEVPRLHPDELSELMSRTVAHGAGALSVIGNAEVTSASAGVGAVVRVADAGAQMAMVRPSGMANSPEAAVVDAIAEVASRGGLPVVVQDAPQITGVELSGAALARLLTDVSEVAAVKVEPPAPGPKIAAVVQALAGAPGTIIGGMGGLDFLHELRRGAVGTMPSPGFHEVFRAIQSRHDAGDFDGAFAVWSRVLPLMVLSARDLDTLLVIQKYLLTRRGVLAGHALRQPHGLVDRHVLADVDFLADHIKLWDLLDECRE